MIPRDEDLLALLLLSFVYLFFPFGPITNTLEPLFRTPEKILANPMNFILFWFVAYSSKI